MNPRRWDEIRAVFDEIVELDATARESRLAAISTTDPELREAVDGLLRADADADAWLAPVESPLGVAPVRDGAHAQSVVPDLQARLQHGLGTAYRVARELGGGGMSHVYVAEETAFRRKVVIKVLRPELSEAISAKRFQREIQLAARLQHPHIVPLLSAGQVDGLLYYTMPFVEGESLRDRLRREGELPVEHVVRILRDVASALAYAHRQGVVHRDIKPENILLSDGGAVVADFGIAKALSASRADRGAGSTTTTITQRGTALGTPLYMAPEQAAGDPATDQRADLYALGAVAYEMLAGRPPFDRASAQALMAAHATEQPETIDGRRPSTPPALAALVMRCLEKRPADRPHDAEQIIHALDDAANATVWSLTQHRATTRSAPRKPLGARRLSWFLVALGLTAGAAAGTALTLLARAKSERRPSRFDLALPDSAAPFPAFDDFGSPVGSAVALSPDGSTLAYVGAASQSLLIRALDDLSPRLLPETEAARCPSFSPDGQWIVFTSRGRLKKVPVRSGRAVVVSDSAGTCAVWTDRNEIVFDLRYQLFRVPAEGGAVSVVAKADSARGIGYMLPSQALPGGSEILVNISESATSDWRLGLVSLPSGRVTRLPSNGEVTRYAPRYAHGYLVFGEGGRGVVAAPFSLRARRFTGPESALLPDPSIMEFGTSDDGTLAYLYGLRPTLSLVAVREDGETRVLHAGSDRSRGDAPDPMPLDTAYYAWPRLSPDGTRVAVEMQTGPFTWDVWVYSIGARTLARLTDNLSGIRPAGWTPDGRHVLFVALDSAKFAGPLHLALQPWDRSAPARKLMALGPTVHDVTVSLQSKTAAYTTGGRNERSDIWMAPLDTPASRRSLVATSGWDQEPRLSRSGRLLAYRSSETGRYEIYIQSLEAPTRRIQVSDGGGSQPMWSQDERRLFYRGPEHVMRVTLDRGPELRIARRDTLFRDVFARHNFTNYDVFPNGRELLMIRTDRSPTRAAVLLNWPALLRQRAATR